MKYSEFLYFLAGNSCTNLSSKLSLLTREKNLLPKFTIEDFAEFMLTQQRIF